MEGLHTGLCCCRGRGIVGGCPWCTVKGQYIHNKVTYPGAVMYLEKDDPLREQYKNEFLDVPGYNELHNSERPQQMTLEKCTASANAVLQAKEEGPRAYKLAKKANPYMDLDVCTAKFPDFDKLKGTLVDPYHEFGNWVNDVRNLIFNVEQTGQQWKKSRRLEEQKYGRFMNLTARAGWHVKEESISRVVALLRTLKVPIGWPDVSGFCIQRKHKKKYMKLAERLAFLGDRGSYILGKL